MDPYLLTFSVGFVSSLISGIAGGGGGLISAPFLVLLGLPVVSAVATAKFSALGKAIGGLTGFRNTTYIRKEYLTILIGIMLLGNILGATLLLNIDEELASHLLAFMMLGSLPFLFFKKDMGLIQMHKSKTYRYIGYVLYFIVSIFQSAFGGGIGMLVPVIMVGLLGFTVLEATATRKLPSVIGASVVLLIFASQGVIDYGLGVSILIGSVIGGWIGTRIAVKQGEVFAKWLLTIVIIVTVGTLFFR